MSINARFQFRYDTAANWTANNPLLLAGELGLESDTNNFKLGNGVSLWTSLPYVAAGPQGPQGPQGSLGNTGSSIINFGGPISTRNTSIIVTGQSGILNTSNIVTWMMGDTTSDHSADEHLMAGIKSVGGNITPSVGFTIGAIADFNVTGNFMIHWLWM